MDIIRNERGAELWLSEKECGQAGISFGSFEKGDEPTERFLAAALGLLRERGIIGLGSDTLDIDVSEEGSGLRVNISTRSWRGNALTAVFTSPDGLEPALRSLPKREGLSCSLWETDGAYALIAEGKALPPDPDERIRAAKIREHGKLLSCSPFDLI